MIVMAFNYFRRATLTIVIERLPSSSSVFSKMLANFWHSSYKKFLFSLVLVGILFLVFHWVFQWKPWWLELLTFLLVFLTVLFVPWRRFCRESYKQALVPLAVIMVLVAVVEQRGCFQRMEGAFFDPIMKAQGSTVPPEIFIVEITNEDYKTLFSEHSPLKPSTVVELIGAVREGCPAVIGVDLDTRSEKDWGSRELWKHKDGKEDIAKLLEDPKIIWAEVPKELGVPKPDREPAIVLDCVLGGKLTGDKVTHVGIARFPQDSDGVVRRLDADYEVFGPLPEHCLTGPRIGANPLVQGELPSFYRVIRQKYEESQGHIASDPDSAKDSQPWRVIDHGIRRTAGVIRKFSDKWCSVANDERMRQWVAIKTKKICNAIVGLREYFKFSGERYSFQIVQASEFLPVAREKTEDGKEASIRSAKSKLFENQIVLIGGNFEAARDDYWTPLGKMAGVELIANAIESDRQEHHLYAATWLGMRFADLIMGSLIVLIYFSFRNHPLAALFFSASSIVGLFYIAYRFLNLGIWLNVAPVMVGMLIHQMYEGTKLSQEIREKLNKANEQIGELSEKMQEANRSAEEGWTQAAEAQFENVKLQAILEELRRRSA
jgi:CHASE2 domain-containing sensor protein